MGPLRCWPGGLCLSRSIGDTDVGEFIVPVPHVKQVKVILTNSGFLILNTLKFSNFSDFSLVGCSFPMQVEG